MEITKKKMQTIFIYIYEIYSVLNIFFGYTSVDKLMNSTAVVHFVNTITILILVVFLFLFASEFKSIKKLFLTVAIAFMICMIVLSLRFNREFIVYALFMFTPFFLNISFNDVVKIDFKVKIIMLGIIVVLCLIGILPNIHGYYNENYKYGLGFKHPNTMAIVAFILVFEWLYLNYKKIKFRNIVVIVFIWFIIYMTTKARTTCYSFFVIFIMFFLYSKCPRTFKNKFVKFLLIIFQSILAAVCIMLTLMFDPKNEFMASLNRVLSARLVIQQEYLKEYGLSLFGQRLFDKEMIVYGMDVTNIIDCAYIKILLYYGVIFFAVFIIIHMVFFYKSIKTNNFEIVLLSMFFVVIGFTESTLLKPAFNVTLLALAAKELKSDKYSIENRIKTLIKGEI